MRPAGTISTIVLLSATAMRRGEAAGWVHRELAATIDFLTEENRILKERLRGRRLRLTDDQPSRAAQRSSPS